MLRGITLIAADDDQMSLEMLSTILGHKGVMVTAVENGRDALDALENNPDVDILLLDLQMPVMNGFQVLEQCKANPYLAEIPVIVLAADHQEKLKSLKLGADDFLAKPYNMEELELRIGKLIQASRLVKSAKKAKSEFLAIASHELRTPMHQIKGLADILSGEGLSADQTELVELLKEATGNLTDIIRDILHYVQLDQGTVTSQIEPFSLRASVQGALDAEQDNARQKGLAVELAIAEDCADALNGPSLYIYKIFSVLINNAVKFSSQGTVRVAIHEESLGRSNSRFCCSVSDDGVGIAEEFREQIFEPFMQIDSSHSRKYEGIGMGLALARRMVELMGGTIEVHSRERSGTTFSFTFQCDVRRVD